MFASKILALLLAAAVAVNVGANHIDCCISSDCTGDCDRDTENMEPEDCNKETAQKTPHESTRHLAENAGKYCSGFDDGTYPFSKNFPNQTCVNFCGNGGDDPHFRDWKGEWFDYHGQCDLVMLADPNYQDGLGFFLHIRTTKRRDYSYIESMALRIGQDTLQISSWGEYHLNGVGGAELPFPLAGFANVTHTQTHTETNKKTHEFNVRLSASEHFTIKTFKDMVTVKFHAIAERRFSEDSMGGLMGNFHGERVGRDHKTVLSDPTEFAEEWQVRGDETMLFQTVRAPQYPVGCERLTLAESEKRRRLGEGQHNTHLQQQAETACAQWKDQEAIKRCVHDVILTGDLDLATEGFY